MIKKNKYGGTRALIFSLGMKKLILFLCVLLVSSSPLCKQIHTWDTLTDKPGYRIIAGLLKLEINNSVNEILEECKARQCDNFPCCLHLAPCELHEDALSVSYLEKEWNAVRGMQMAEETEHDVIL